RSWRVRSGRRKWRRRNRHERFPVSTPIRTLLGRRTTVLQAGNGSRGVAPEDHEQPKGKVPPAGTLMEVGHGHAKDKEDRRTLQGQAQGEIPGGVQGTVPPRGDSR